MANAWATPCLQASAQLKDDTFRGRIFGAGELRLEDWFVPVLYQEKDDPQLFKITPAKQTQEDFKAALAARLGDLPPEPETGFIGRSRELLALQRLLREERYAVVRGQGGEGKDRARGRVCALDGSLTADAPRRVRLGRDARQSACGC